jgi:hypothetical protein
MLVVMRRLFATALLAALALGGTALIASPASAAPQSIFGTTVDVTAVVSGDSLLGETAYVPEGSVDLLAELNSVLAFDVDVTVLDGPTTLGTCTIAIGDLSCVVTTTALPAGATPVTARFAGSTTVDFTGTLFSVTNVAPSVFIEWQDASGAWVDGSNQATPLLGDTAVRCLVTNNSNAAITFDSFNGEGGDSGVVPITGTLEAGATAIYPLWSGPVSSNPTASCSGSITLLSGEGNGGGTGGGTIPGVGTISASATPAPGTTVTVTGDGLEPRVIFDYAVLLDGVEVPGSPVTPVGPDFDFSIDVQIPASLEPGTYAITVQGTFEGRDIAFAYFPFDVAQPESDVAQPELAATGPSLTEPVGIAALVLAAGALLVVAARRSSREV